MSRNKKRHFKNRIKIYDSVAGEFDENGIEDNPAVKRFKNRFKDINEDLENPEEDDDQS